MNSSPTLNELLVLSHLSVTHVSLQRHHYKDAKNGVLRSVRSMLRLEKTNKQTKPRSLKSLGTTLKTRALIPIWSAVFNTYLLFCKDKVSEEIKFR